MWFILVFFELLENRKPNKYSLTLRAAQCFKIFEKNAGKCAAADLYI